jgi:uncharacterized membrane protein YbjE (DUF340 family)
LSTLQKACLAIVGLLYGPLVLVDLWISSHAMEWLLLRIVVLVGIPIAAALAAVAYSHKAGGLFLAPAVLIGVVLGSGWIARSIAELQVQNFCELVVRRPGSPYAVQPAASSSPSRTQLRCRVQEFEMGGYWIVGVYSGPTALGSMELARRELSGPLEILR